MIIIMIININTIMIMKKYQNLIPARNDLSNSHCESERLLPVKTWVKFLSWNKAFVKGKWKAIRIKSRKPVAPKSQLWPLLWLPFKTSNQIKSTLCYCSCKMLRRKMRWLYGRGLHPEGQSWVQQFRFPSRIEPSDATILPQTRSLDRFLTHQQLIRA